MQHRSIIGRIQYLSRKPESFGANRGSERFHFTHHRDGSVVLRATCELEIPEPKILRDVIVSYDPDGRVSDCHLRVLVGDQLMGTAWYFLEGDHLEMQAFSPRTGRQWQRIALPESIESLGTHPIVNDGYLLKALDLKRGPHKRAVQLFIVSPDHRGASPPVIAPVKIWMEYVGDEAVEVRAGRFHTHHFRYTDEGGSGLDGAHPDINVWVTADGDYVYVKGAIGGYFMSEYELVEYQQTPADP